MELKLPSMRVELALLMFTEDFELSELLQTNFVVSSLKITLENVFLSPRPLIRQFVVMFVAEKKLFDLFLESPEGRPTINVEIGLTSFDEVEEAERIEDGVITT